MPQFDILSWFNQVSILFVSFYMIYRLCINFGAKKFIYIMTVRLCYYNFLNMLVKRDINKGVLSHDFFTTKLKHFMMF